LIIIEKEKQSHPQAMDPKIHHGYDRMIEVGNNLDRSGSEDPLKTVRKVSLMSELRDEASTDDDEKKEDESINNGSAERFRSARGSGWIGTTTSAFSKNKTPNRRNHSTAQDILEKLQREASAGPSCRNLFAMPRTRNNNNNEDASSTSVRYKFAAGSKTDAQMKKEKQRKWKEKMKIAQERKRQERRALDGDGSRIDMNQDTQGIFSCVFDNVEQTEFFEQFARCGDQEDEDSIYELWSASESSVATSDEDQSGTPRDGKPRGRRKRGRNRRPRILPESSRRYFSDTSNESSVEEGMTTLSETKEDIEQEQSIGKKIPQFLRPMPNSNELDVMHDPNPTSNPREPPPIEMQTSYTAKIRSSKTKKKLNVSPSSSIRPTRGASQSRHSSSTMTTRPATPPKAQTFINDFVEDLRIMGESMLWHKEPAGRNAATVTIHLKRGCRCRDGTFCAPSLVWADDAKAQKYGVDLLDIQSLKMADTMELKNFPYASPGRTISVKTAYGGNFILEARSGDDAFRFIRGIRWVVSRLAFNLVIGSIDVRSELLDLGLMESPANPPSEFAWSDAMDDVADQFVRATLEATMI
jgi:hypothetical protein